MMMVMMLICRRTIRRKPLDWAELHDQLASWRKNVEEFLEKVRNAKVIAAQQPL